MDIGDDGMSVHGQLSLRSGRLATTKRERTVSDNQAGADRTHVEDNEDPVELGLPSRNGLLVVPRVKESRGRIAPALLDDPVLYLCDGPGIESMISRRTRNYNTAGPRLTSSTDLSHRTPTG